MPVRYLSVPPCLLVQLRGVFLDPAVDRGVIDRHAAFGHHFLQIAVAHPVAAVPPHCLQNDVTGEMTTGEDTHGCDYFTSRFLLPQLCNNTRDDICAAPGRLNMNYNLETLIVTIPMMIAMVAMINDMRIEFDNSTPMAAGPTTCPRLYQVVRRAAPPFIL